MKKLGKLIDHMKRSWCHEFGHEWIWVLPSTGPLVNTIDLRWEKKTDGDHIQECRRCHKYRLKGEDDE